MNYYRKDKIITNEYALENLSNDKNLVFISGCFDILHSGHLYFFREAKKIAGHDSKIICVIHDDKSVKEHKGENRPVNKLEDRMDLLSELEIINFVTPWYGWESVAKFFIDLHPGAIAVTKTSYENKTLKKIVDDNKIQLIEISMKSNISTTSIINILEI